MDKRNDQPAQDAHAESQDPAEAFAQFYGSPGEVINRYTHCAICGANLHFSHLTDFSKNLTQETARCPECGIKARQVLHKLQ